MIKYGGGFAEAPWLKHGFDALWSLYILFQFSLFIRLSTYLLYQRIFVCFYLLDYHCIICSIRYMTSKASTYKTHQNWKNELWIWNVSVYYMLLHSRYLLKQRPYSPNHLVSMFRCCEAPLKSFVDFVFRIHHLCK